MNLCVLANDEQKKELLSKPLHKDTHLHFLTSQTLLTSEVPYDGFFLLDPSLNFSKYYHLLKDRPVIINEVIITLNELNAPNNFHRINAWPTFLIRPSWEISTKDAGCIQQFFNQVGWNVFVVNDQCGLIAARVIAMIINEAFYALGDNVSTEKDIDIAMKLGTNYPYGPFEWSKLIGLRNISSLLNKLAEHDKSYAPAPALQNALNN